MTFFELLMIIYKYIAIYSLCVLLILVTLLLIQFISYRILKKNPYKWICKKLGLN